MKKIALLLALVTLLSAIGCEMHPPRTEEKEGKESVIDKVKERDDMRSEGANPNAPKFFSPTPSPSPGQS